MLVQRCIFGLIQQCPFYGVRPSLQPWALPSWTSSQSWGLKQREVFLWHAVLVLYLELTGLACWKSQVPKTIALLMINHPFKENGGSQIKSFRKILRLRHSGIIPAFTQVRLPSLSPLSLSPIGSKSQERGGQFESGVGRHQEVLVHLHLLSTYHHHFTLHCLPNMSPVWKGRHSRSLEDLHKSSVHLRRLSMGTWTLVM